VVGSGENMGEEDVGRVFNNAIGTEGFTAIELIVGRKV